LSSLLQRKPPGGRGKSRLPPRLRDHEVRAASETKRARRARERRPATITTAPDQTAVDLVFADLDLATIRPFEIEDGP